MIGLILQTQSGKFHIHAIHIWSNDCVGFTYQVINCTDYDSHENLGTPGTKLQV